MDDGTREIRPSRAAGTDPYEEEFLYHLSRGSEFLVENDVERAKEELERALRHQPHDAKGQDLLAGVYFRLGLYPRAIEIWSRLVQTHPSDLALSVNLGLVLLKTGQPHEARVSFQRATEIDPKHARAYRYLGLAEWRCGHLESAREAFLRGGEVTMARRMAEMLGDGDEPTSARPPEDAAERAEIRSTASDALERFAAETAPLEVEPPTDSTGLGPWRVVEQGRESVPRTVRAAHADAPTRAESLAQRLEAWTVRTDAGPALTVAANGLLRIATREPVAFRNERLVAARGRLVTDPLMRRTRTEADAACPLGGDAPIVRASAGLFAYVAPPEGLRFVAIALADDGLFVLERCLEAFEGALAFETARIGAETDVVSLRGTGIVVLRLRAEPAALEVAPGEVMHVHPRALVGWVGRLFPADDPEASVSGMLAFRGEGTLLAL